jgi:NADPH:quinone reductase-like Zn-dependent oxidoreductase
MRAAAIDRFGGPQELRTHTLPVPKPGPQEILIAVDTAGVGTWDLSLRDGSWAEGETTFPLVLGTDGSGTVVQTGSRVRRLHAGDRVYAYTLANPKGGFYAEYVAVAAGKAAPFPDSLDMQQAGAVAVTGLTALQGIDDALGIEAGETLLIHGASGNVGCLALQFAKWRGARVLATASGRAGVDFVRRLGADHAIDGRRAHVDKVAVEKAAAKFAPDGIDAVLAFVGPGVPSCLNTLRKGGRAAYPNGIEPEPRKRKGLKLRAYDAAVGVREFARLGRAIEESRLQVPIAEAFSLENAAAAHRRLAQGHVFGRIVLRTAPDR